MQYIVIAAIGIILIAASVKLFHQKITAPSTIFLAGYAISALFAYFGSGSWHDERELSGDTIVMVVGTMLSFFAGSTIINLFRIRKKKSIENNKANKKEALRIIRVDALILMILGVVLLGTVVMEYMDLRGICAKYSCSASSLSDLIGFYRFKSYLFVDDGENLSFLTQQLIKISNIIIFSSIYIFINNLLLKDGVKRNIPYVIFAILSIPIALLQSGRSNLLAFIIGAVVIYVYLYERNNNSEFKISKIVKKIAPVGIVVIILFYASGALIGREAKGDIDDYTTFYYGCPIPSLNIALRTGQDDDIELTPLQNSMRGIGKSLGKIGINTDQSKKNSLRFITLGDYYSNVYTSGYKLYLDFGLILSFFFTFVSGMTYGLIFKLCNKKGSIVLLIFYSMCVYRLLDSARSDGFYSTFLTTTTLVNYAMTYLMVKILFREREKNERV